jgi:ubiquinone/menaquinone biosynthesis C-methylase UbiE
MDERREATERAQRYWDKKAPTFDREMGFYEKILFKGARSWACSHARGDVLEVAVGTGRNLSFYPAGTRLTGIELSPNMLRIAEHRRDEVMPQADLRPGDAQQLEFADSSFDTVVCTCSLCSIPDDAAAVAEIKRVLRPGGILVAVEHVRSPSKIIATIQRMLEPIARKQGDSLIREPLEHLGREELAIETLERSKLGIVERVVARKAS